MEPETIDQTESRRDRMETALLPISRMRQNISYDRTTDRVTVEIPSTCIKIVVDVGACCPDNVLTFILMNVMSYGYGVGRRDVQDEIKKSLNL